MLPKDNKVQLFGFLNCMSVCLSVCLLILDPDSDSYHTSLCSFT